jgi:flagellar FliJ protein
MAKFTFEFENVKRVKEILEKQAQKEVSLIDSQIARQYEERRSVEEARRRLALNVERNPRQSVFELQRKAELERALDEKERRIERLVAELKRKRQKKLDQLVERSKERKIFETLKERRYEAYLTEERRQEQKDNDDMTAQKYARGES